MCVIVYKPADALPPAEPLLRLCWDRNPDGAGLMWPESGSLRFVKGLMSWDAFLATRRSLSKGRMLEDVPVAIHFRVSTSGSVGPEQCHPFPMNSPLRTDRRCEGRAAAALMHNGEFSRMKSLGDESDTMVFMRTMVRPLCSRSRDCLSDERALGIIDDAREGSRLLMMDGCGIVKMLGDWLQEAGLFFSKRVDQPKRLLSAPSM